MGAALFRHYYLVVSGFVDNRLGGFALEECTVLRPGQEVNTARGPVPGSTWTFVGTSFDGTAAVFSLETELDTGGILTRTYVASDMELARGAIVIAEDGRYRTRCEPDPPTDGNDVIIGDDFSNRLDGEGGDDLVVGKGQRDRLIGGTGNDTLKGGADIDTLEGGSGRDSLQGGADDDLLFGGRGNDVLEGGDGKDRMSGGSGNDEMSGGESRDILLGGTGNDEIVADGGRDVLVGGSGNDTLSGGAGADRFVFDDDWGRDQIRDFDPTADVLDLRRVEGLDARRDLDIDTVAAGVRIRFDGDTIILNGLNESDISGLDILV